MTRIDSRYGPAALAVAAFVLTFAAVLFYGATDRPDPAEEREAEALEREVAETRATTGDLTEAVVRFGLEVAAAREDAAAAREEATAAYQEMVALAGRLAAAERENARLAARQEVLEAALAALQRRAPEVTLLVPEPEVTVETAEPEVTVEPPGEGAGAARTRVERAEPRVRVERPRAADRGPGPVAMAAVDLVGSEVVNDRGEAIARVADVVRHREGGDDALYLVLDVGNAAAAGARRVAIPRDALERGPGGELVLPEEAERGLADLPAFRTDAYESLPR